MNNMILFHYKYIIIDIIQKIKKDKEEFLKGIGPATAHRYSWSVASERTVDYSSIIYDLYDRKPGL